MIRQRTLAQRLSSLDKRFLREIEREKKLPAKQARQRAEVYRVVSSVLAKRGSTMSDELRARVARALRWTVHDTYSASIPSLRELVRRVSPKLAQELAQVIRSDAHLAVAR